ncbi:MAG: hypothetical protein N2202_02150 [Proteobacteria bacterium]|nr:hypothetical protein [Pseudomonadota bacterium]
MADNEIKQDIDELERKIERLKHEYEKFFLGIINVEPLQLKNEVVRLIRKYATKQINNVMLNFKYKNLTSRFLLYQEYWNRNLRLIEEGKNPKEIIRYQAKTTATPSITKEEKVEKRADYKDLYQEYSNVLTKKGQNPPSEEAFIKKMEELKSSVKSKYGDNVETDFKIEETDKGVKIKTTVRKKSS